jgi:hypothetical protein
MIARLFPRAARAAATIALVATGTACAAAYHSPAPGAPSRLPRTAQDAGGAEGAREMETRAGAEEAGGTERVAVVDRMLVHRVILALEAENLVALRDRAASTAAAMGGYVENVTLEQRGYPDRPSLRMTLRVPAPSLDAMLDTLRGAGRVRAENRQALDVTEEVVDADARLRNLIGVRDRLREHLTRSGNVADVVAVERELARVQGQIDALEARLKHLRGTVALAEISLAASPRVVLGPLGVVAKGLGWVVAKLFVIR